MQITQPMLLLLRRIHAQPEHTLYAYATGTARAGNGIDRPTLERLRHGKYATIGEPTPKGRPVTLTLFGEQCLRLHTEPRTPRDTLYRALVTGSVGRSITPDADATALIDAHHAHVVAGITADSAPEFADAIRKDAITDCITVLNKIADETDHHVSSHYGTHTGIGPGSADFLREAGKLIAELIPGATS